MPTVKSVSAAGLTAVSLPAKTIPSALKSASTVQASSVVNKPVVCVAQTVKKPSTTSPVPATAVAHSQVCMVVYLLFSWFSLMYRGQYIT